MNEENILPERLSEFNYLFKIPSSRRELVNVKKSVLVLNTDTDLYGDELLFTLNEKFGNIDFPTIKWCGAVTPKSKKRKDGTYDIVMKLPTNLKTIKTGLVHTSILEGNSWTLNFEFNKSYTINEISIDVLFFKDETITYQRELQANITLFNNNIYTLFNDHSSFSNTIVLTINTGTLNNLKEIEYRTFNSSGSFKKGLIKKVSFMLNGKPLPSLSNIRQCVSSGHFQAILELNQNVLMLNDYIIIKWYYSATISIDNEFRKYSLEY